MWRRSFIVAAICTIAAGARVPSQELPRFKAESEVVVLHVTVKDRHGSYVPGLTADAFRVLEDNRPQTTSFFASEDAPVTIGLVIDSSGSMRGARDLVIAASAAFVETSNTQDEVFALVFNDDVRSVLGSSAVFTSDANRLRTAMASVFQPVGRTALYDAIADGLSYVTKGTRDRRVLVVLSDGGDNASRATLADVLMLAQASNTVVYTIALVDPVEGNGDPGRLKRFAETSGGTAFSPRRIEDVSRAFEQIARDIRHGYSIGYVPDGALQEGFRRLRVEVRSPDGQRLVTRTRTGYVAGHGER